MKIASWNVNSLNVRLPHVVAWSDVARPDVLALQETKLTDDRFPVQELHEIGYHSVFSGQKTYNGVAILSREEAHDPVTDIAGLDDPQRRILAATVGGVRIVNLYVVNGSEVGSEKFEYKIRWPKKWPNMKRWSCWATSISHPMTGMYTIRKNGARKSSAAHLSARRLAGSSPWA